MTAVFKNPRSATRSPRSVSSSARSFGPAGARMALKDVAGIALWEILHTSIHAMERGICSRGLTGLCIAFLCDCR